MKPLFVIGIMLALNGCDNKNKQVRQDRDAAMDHGSVNPPTADDQQSQEQTSTIRPSEPTPGSPPRDPGGVHGAFDGWRSFPIRSEQEFLAGEVGGEAEQHNQGIARSRSNPDIVYLSHDCGQVWRSTNAGGSWQKTINKGLYSEKGNSVEVDPINPKVLLVQVSAGTSGVYESPYQGLYRSEDGGDSWRRVIKQNVVNSRRYQHNVAYSLSSVNGREALTWYAAFEDTYLYRSDDGGRTFAQGASLSGHASVYSVKVDSRDKNILYIATSRGLFKSTDAGSSIQAVGALPSGPVVSIEVVENTPNIIYAVVPPNGLFKSINGGASFSLMNGIDSQHVFINQGYPNVMFLVSSSGSSHSKISMDSGATWNNTPMDPPSGLDREYKNAMSGGMTGIVPNPNNPLDAVAYSRAQPWKMSNGRSYKSASTLFTGYNSGFWMNGFDFGGSDSDRFAFFTADVGMVVTSNYGDWFERKSIDRGSLDVPWSSVHGGAMIPGTNSAVIGVGDGTSSRKLARVDNFAAGFMRGDWRLVDSETNSYLQVLVDPNNSNNILAGYKRSTDQGNTWENIPSLVPFSGAVIIGRCKQDPAIVFAVDGERNSILRSTDNGGNFREYGARATPGGSFAPKDSKPTVNIDPLDCGKVYAGRSIDGDLWSYDGSEWKKLNVIDLVNARNPGVNNFVRAVVVDPNHNNIIYAGVYAPGTESVWRSMDRGNSWEDLSFNLPRLPAGGLTINPRSGELIRSGCDGNYIFPPPYPTTKTLYEKAVSIPSCKDGLKNGNETAVDIGGHCI